MICWPITLGRLSAIFLFTTTTFCLLPCPVAAQELKTQPVPTDHADVAPSSISHGDELRPSRQDLTGDSLPDPPRPNGQAQEQGQNSVVPSGLQPNQVLGLPPTLTRTHLTVADKLQIYIHKAFGPPAVILPAFGTGFQEDPRYQRSISTNPLRRTFHALAFTVIDKTDSGRNTLAVSNFASAAAGGFVGMGILPHGYNNVTHAEQRMASEFLQIVMGNIATEFEPQWGPLAQKIHLQKILPAWWVPQHSH